MPPLELAAKRLINSHFVVTFPFSPTVGLPGLPWARFLLDFFQNRIHSKHRSFYYWEYSKECTLSSVKLLLKHYFKKRAFIFICHKILWVTLLECLYPKGAALARIYVMVCLHLISVFTMNSHLLALASTYQALSL